MKSSSTKKVLTVVFYQEASGREPVLSWLKELPKKDRLCIGTDLQTLQYGWPIGMPLVRPLGKGLWEIRTNLDNRIARIIFIIEKDLIFVLHGFIKKTQKTPQQDLELALNRFKKLLR